MPALASALFRGDSLLQSIADDHDRISATRHPKDPAVGKVQLALLDWDPNCLPRFGADGSYGGEAEAAVARFKVEELGVPPAGLIRDVGPKTVLKLDEMQVALDAQRAARTVLIDKWIGGPLSGLASAPETAAIAVPRDGDSAFAALNAALARCVSDKALIVIAGWDFHETTLLAPGRTAGDALRAAATKGARVRALFGHFPIVKSPQGEELPIMPGQDNTGATAFVNGLPKGAAIHDSLVLHRVISGALTGLGAIQVGMHHQKAWVVFDGARLTAFCGGIDINPNRTTLSATPPLHDVQLELGGAPAGFVYDVLRTRWNTHPEAPAGVTLPEIPTPSAPPGKQRARVVTTFGNPALFAGLGPPQGGTGTRPPYPFAPTGSKAYRDLLFQLIDRTERFIYLEEQYLVDEEIAIKLASALPRIKALIIVIAATGLVNGELFRGWERRKRFLDRLAPHAAKVATCVGSQLIHSKTWVFDDTIAVVGSANVNRRGLKHDSEMGVAFGDLIEPGPVKRLREGLWAKHLGTAAPAPAEPP